MRISEHLPLYNWSCTQKYYLYEDSWQRARTSPRKTLKHHLYKSSRTLHCCLLTLACADLTQGFIDVRVWLPGDLWATCYLWASLIPFILLEVERTELQFPSCSPNFWGVELLEKTHTVTGAQKSPLSPLLASTWPRFLRPSLFTHKMGVITIPFSQVPFPCPVSSPCKCYKPQIQGHLYIHWYKGTLIPTMTNKHAIPVWHRAMWEHWNTNPSFCINLHTAEISYTGGIIDPHAREQFAHTQLIC